MLKSLLPIALILSVAPPSSATLFDDFGTASPTVYANSAGSWSQGSSVDLGNGIARSLTTAVASNSAPRTARAGSVVGNGAYTFGSDAGVDGWGQIDYRFASMDLRGVTSFRIEFLASDRAGSIGLTLGDADADMTIRPVAIPVSASPFTLLLEVPTYAAQDLDLAHATNLGLWIDTGAGGHVGIDAIRSVPEPASFGVLGIGALGLLRRRRR